MVEVGEDQIISMDVSLILNFLLEVFPYPTFFFFSFRLLFLLLLLERF